MVKTRQDKAKENKTQHNEGVILVSRLVRWEGQCARGVSRMRSVGRKVRAIHEL